MSNANWEAFVFATDNKKKWLAVVGMFLMERSLSCRNSYSIIFLVSFHQQMSFLLIQHFLLT